MNRNIPFIFLTNGATEKIKVKTKFGNVYIWSWDNDYKIGNNKPITITFGELEPALFRNCNRKEEIAGEHLDRLISESINYRNKDKNFLFVNGKIQLVKADKKSASTK